MQIGLNLRRLRLERGISQQTVAFDANLSLPYLSGIERGKENATVGVIARIAKALGVAPSEFFTPISPRSTPSKNLPRGRNVHHRGRRPSGTRRKT